MEKLTPAQAAARQARLDRRAATADRRDPVLAADNARLNGLYAAATTVKATTTQGPVAVAATPADVQALVALIAPLWAAQVGTAFPETVWFGPSTWSEEFTYWVDGTALNSLLPAMYRKGGKLCARYSTKPGVYRFRTPSLNTVYNRLRQGLPVFAA